MINWRFLQDVGRKREGRAEPGQEDDGEAGDDDGGGHPQAD